MILMSTQSLEAYILMERDTDLGINKRKVSQNRKISALFFEKEKAYMDAVMATTHWDEGKTMPMFWEHAILSRERT